MITVLPRASSATLRAPQAHRLDEPMRAGRLPYRRSTAASGVQPDEVLHRTAAPYMIARPGR